MSADPQPSQTAPMPTTRLPGETAKAYAAFRAFCQLGPERSYKKTGKKLRKNTTTLGDWASKYSWQERANTYDAEQVELQRQADAQAMLERARERERRKDELIDRAWDVGNKLHGKMLEMLAFPVATKKTTKGPDGTTIIVMPGKWNFNDLPRYAAVMRDLAAFAVGMPSTISEHRGKDGADLPLAGVGPDGELVLPEVRITIEHQTKEGAPIASPPAPGELYKAPTPVPAGAAAAPAKPAASTKSEFKFTRST